MSTRVVFAGSPDVAIPYLRALHHAQFDIRAVITREDSRQGRKGLLMPTAVAAAADELGLSLIKANSLRDVQLPDVEIAIVVAYGGLVPTHLLGKPTHGWVNVHFSVLPQYRGAAPLQRAMWDGEPDAGISIFRLVDELDAGPVYFSRSIPFEPDETASDALARIAIGTTGDLIGTLRLIIGNAIAAKDQIGQPSFARKLTRADGRIDWSLGAATVIQRIRAVSREPGAHTTFNGDVISVVRVASEIGPPLGIGEVVVRDGRVFVGTSYASVELLEIKPAGKTQMSAVAWLRGQRASVVFQ